MKEKFDYTFELGIFNVLKARYKTLDIEIAPARKEVYIEGDLTHKNFEAEFLTGCDFKERAIRRDFTINALGIAFKDNQVKFLDPFHGVEHLINEELENCGNGFSKDPVRYLRAIRFKNKFNLSLTKQLTEQMSHMDITEVSAHYFNYEASKVGYNTFFSDLLKISDELNVTLPESLREIKVGRFKNSEREHFVFSLLLDNKTDIVKNVSSFLGVGEKLFNRLSVLFELCFNYGGLDKNGILKNHKLTDHAGHIYQIFQVYKNEGKLFEKLSIQYSEIKDYLILFQGFNKKEHQLTVDFCRKHNLDQSNYGVVGLLLNLNLL